jgi:hypothetical protein
MGYYLVKTLLHSKGNNYQNQDATYTMSNIFCQFFIGLRINVQNIESLPKLKHQKKSKEVNSQMN